MSVSTITREDHDLTPTASPVEKTVLYRCGTAAPGQVHDPCQHSLVTVLCCTCAGCMFDLWSCGQPPIGASNEWWQAHMIAERCEPWVRHPIALIIYALLIIFALASHIVTYVIQLLLLADLVVLGMVLSVISLVL